MTRVILGKTAVGNFTHSKLPKITQNYLAHLPNSPHHSTFFPTSVVVCHPLKMASLTSVLLNTTIWDDALKGLFTGTKSTNGGNKTITSFFKPTALSIAYTSHLGHWEKLFNTAIHAPNPSSGTKLLMKSPLLKRKVEEICAAYETVAASKVRHGNDKSAGRSKEPINSPHVGPYFQLPINLELILQEGKRKSEFAALDTFFVSPTTGNAVEGVLILDPEVYHGFQIHCVKCQGNKVHKDGFGEIVLISGMHGDVLGVPRKYKCSSCSTKFQTSTEKFWEIVPYEIRKGMSTVCSLFSKCWHFTNITF